MKVCIAFSAGGHFIEAKKASSLLFECQEYEIFYLTYRTKTADKYKGSKVVYVVHPKHCNLLKRSILFIMNLCNSLIVYLLEKPDIIISTGADVTIGIMIVGKIFRKPIVFIESGANVNAPSMTGRFAYHISNLFIIQWEEQKKYYPKAILGGPLL
jgi:UDP-N-acetylglucosamine:LPS N-acetylglucosamine transferase